MALFKPVCDRARTAYVHWSVFEHTHTHTRTHAHTSPVGPLLRRVRGGGAGGDLFWGAVPFRRPGGAFLRITRTNVSRFKVLQTQTGISSSHQVSDTHVQHSEFDGWTQQT